MKFKDIVARWVREVNGKPKEPLTAQERNSVTQDLQGFLEWIDMDSNRMQFKDLSIKSRTVNTFDQEVTIRITLDKMGNGGLLIKELN